MSKAEKTKALIIEKTASVFNRKGYAGTSLTDLTEATGLTKGSIYGNFENKDEVAIAVFEYNVKAVNKGLDAAVAGKKTAGEKLIAYTEHFRNNWKSTFDHGGCPVLNASVEADDNLPFLKKHVQEGIKSWVMRICKIIEEGKSNGEFHKEIIATDYAYTIITIIEGGIMLGKILNNQNLLFAATDRVISIINQEIKA